MHPCARQDGVGFNVRKPKLVHANPHSVAALPSLAVLAVGTALVAYSEPNRNKYAWAIPKHVHLYSKVFKHGYMYGSGHQACLLTSSTCNSDGTLFGKVIERFNKMLHTVVRQIPHC